MEQYSVIFALWIVTVYFEMEEALFYSINSKLKATKSKINEQNQRARAFMSSILVM